MGSRFTSTGRRNKKYSSKPFPDQVDEASFGTPVVPRQVLVPEWYHSDDPAAFFSNFFETLSEHLQIPFGPLVLCGSQKYPGSRSGFPKSPPTCRRAAFSSSPPWPCAWLPPPVSRPLPGAANCSGTCAVGARGPQRDLLDAERGAAAGDGRGARVRRVLQQPPRTHTLARLARCATIRVAERAGRRPSARARACAVAGACRAREPGKPGARKLSARLPGRCPCALDGPVTPGSPVAPCPCLILTTVRRHRGQTARRTARAPRTI